MPGKTFRRMKVDQWKTPENFDIYFCVAFDCNCQKFYYFKGNWGEGRRFYLTGGMTNDLTFPVPIPDEVKNQLKCLFSYFFMMPQMVL